MADWDVDRAAELYRSGLTLRQVGDEFGVSLHVARNRLIQAGVERRPRSGTALPADTGDIVRLRDVEKLEWEQIARLVGMSAGGAYRRYKAATEGRPNQWRQLLVGALRTWPVIEVAAFVERYLGRPPTRAEITAARRAAGRLAGSGACRIHHATMPSKNQVGRVTHLLVARSDATDDQVQQLVDERNRSL